jgi:hypothetical protein
MKRIVIAPREGRQIEVDLGECMACLQNAGIRDYTARLERYGVFWVADRLFAPALQALVDAGFEVPSKADEVARRFTDRSEPRISTAIKGSEPCRDGGKP